jgi:hypothetical protein
MTDKDLAKLIRVNQNTITNWKKSKPELYRLIRLGIDKEVLYKDFFDLFKSYINNNFFMENTFYIDFYFRFLNYFRQNVTNHHDLLHRKNNTDIESTLIYYLMEESNFFGQEFIVKSHDLEKFKRDSFQRPIMNMTSDLEEYILKNTIDDWETLVRDIALKDSDITKFEIAIKFSFYSMLYKTNSLLTYEEKTEYVYNLMNNLSFKTKEINKTLKKYIAIKDQYILENCDALIDWNGHYRNEFYIPEFVDRLKEKV